MQRFFIWLGRKLFPNANPAAEKQSSPPPSHTPSGTAKPGSGTHAAGAPKSAAEHVALRESGKHAVEKESAGKKPPELRLEDERGAKQADEEEFNPYNTGSFDRSKTWESRKRK